MPSCYLFTHALFRTACHYRDSSVVRWFGSSHTSRPLNTSEFRGLWIFTIPLRDQTTLRHTDSHQELRSMPSLIPCKTNHSDSNCARSVASAGERHVYLRLAPAPFSLAARTRLAPRTRREDSTRAEDTPRGLDSRRSAWPRGLDSHRSAWPRGLDSRRAHAARPAPVMSLRLDFGSSASNRQIPRPTSAH